VEHIQDGAESSREKLEVDKYNRKSDRQSWVSSSSQRCGSDGGESNGARNRTILTTSIAIANS
jgi:hypothetical protein